MIMQIIKTKKLIIYLLANAIVMASDVYKVCAFCDFTRAARTFPSANPTMIGPSASQIKQVTEEL